MKVVFNSWSGAFFNPGGGEVQLLETKKALERKKITVELYDQWRPQLDLDVFHQFSIEQGVEFPVRHYRRLNVRLALSTILWERVPLDVPLYHRIRELFTNAGVLLTNSNAESERLASWYKIDLEKFHRTRNAVSTAFLNTDTAANFRKAFDLNGDFVLSVANIDRRKNTHQLVAACERLGKKLVLIGHVRDEAYFEEFRGSSSGLIYLGPIVEPDILKSAYQQCAVFALPSLCETPGIAALEAASQGAKIVITNQGPTDEYFGSTVTYVDPFSVDSIAKGIEAELNTKRDRQDSIGHITQNYNWDKTAEDVLRGYEKI